MRAAVAVALALSPLLPIAWHARQFRSESSEPSAVAPPALLPITLRAKESGERSFVDSAGRERYFRGANAISKGPPWVPATDEYSKDLSMVPADMDILKARGLNMLRLGTMWPGVEPVRGQYNETYLDELEKIVDWAASRGIYTLLDMHQDDLSEYFCGEGIPAWAVVSDVTGFPHPLDKPYATHAEPLAGGALFPTRQDCAKHVWMDYQPLAHATGAAYEALYTNVNGTADAWGAMLAHVAARFRGKAHVLGIELINEPYAGDTFRHPSLLLPYPSPWNADHALLQPAYDRVSGTIRAKDAERLLFFAGTTWDDLGPGFSAPPGGPEFADRSVLAYHYYTPPQGIAESTAHYVGDFVKGARRLKTGVFLTETAGGQGLWDAAEHALQSFAVWEYKAFCREDNATLNSSSQNAVVGACKTGIGPYGDNQERLQDYVRPYVSAVQGNATAASLSGSVYTLAFAADPAIALPTEIRVPRQGADAPVVTVAPPEAASVAYDAAEETLAVRASVRGAVEVRVQRSAPRAAELCVRNELLDELDWAPVDLTTGVTEAFDAHFGSGQTRCQRLPDAGHIVLPRIRAVVGAPRDGNLAVRSDPAGGRVTFACRGWHSLPADWACSIDHAEPAEVRTTTLV